MPFPAEPPDPTTCLHYQLKTAVVTLLQGLALPMIGKNVLNLRMQNTRTIAWERVTLPCLVVDTGGAGDVEELGGGTSETYQDEWPLRVIIVARFSEKDHTQEPWVLYWRQLIVNALRSRLVTPPLSGITGSVVIRLTVKPGPIFLPIEAREGIDLTLSILNLRILATQLRP
jgi:hypothetical protein